MQLIPGKEGEITNFSLIGNTRHVTQDTGIHKRFFWSELLHVKFHPQEMFFFLMGWHIHPMFTSKLIHNDAYNPPIIYILNTKLPK